MVHQLSLLAIVSAVLLGGHSAAAQAPAAPKSATAIAPATAASQQRRTLRLVLAPTGNEARYRVREQLAGIDLPSDAVGKTTQVAGMLIIGTDGKINKDSSRFAVDLATLATDASRRDNYVRTRALQTAEFPVAVFVPATATGLPATLPTSGEVTFDLAGDLTIHGVTRPTIWKVKARMGPNDTVTGTATTNFKFGDFNMTIPRVAAVLSVDDSITLEYDFQLVPKAP